jgi:bifunctional DNase/RNase
MPTDAVRMSIAIGYPVAVAKVVVEQDEVRAGECGDDCECPVEHGECLRAAKSAAPG